MKKTYTKPRLDVYGGVAVLTKGTGWGLTDLPAGIGKKPKAPKGS